MPLYQGVCYPSDAAAKIAACSGASTSWGSGSSLYTSECTNTEFSGAYMDICRRTDGGPCTMTQVPYPTFQPCDYDGGANLALDWMYLVLPIFAVLYGAKKLLALFDSNDRE